MSKKKSVLFIVIALVVGIAVGVGVTLGVVYGKNGGTIVAPRGIIAMSETEIVNDEYDFPVLNTVYKTASSCEMIKTLEVLKNDEVISQQRLVSAKWKIAVDGDCTMVPFFIHTSHGEKTVEKDLWHTPKYQDNQTTLVVTYIPTDVESNIFEAPGEIDTDLHLFFNLFSDSYVSDDGKILVTDTDKFLSGDYSGTIFYGTEEELADSDYSFLGLYANQIKFHDPSELKTDVLFGVG